MDMPERLRPWLERTGLEERGHLPMRTACLALARSVPTFADARRLTDAITERLGHVLDRSPALLIDDRRREQPLGIGAVAQHHPPLRAVLLLDECERAEPLDDLPDELRRPRGCDNPPSVPNSWVAQPGAQGLAKRTDAVDCVAYDRLVRLLGSNTRIPVQRIARLTEACLFGAYSASIVARADAHEGCRATERFAWSAQGSPFVTDRVRAAVQIDPMA